MSEIKNKRKFSSLLTFIIVLKSFNKKKTWSEKTFVQ